MYVCLNPLEAELVACILLMRSLHATEERMRARSGVRLGNCLQQKQNNSTPRECLLVCPPRDFATIEILHASYTGFNCGAPPFAAKSTSLITATPSSLYHRQNRESSQQTIKKSIAMLGSHHQLCVCCGSQIHAGRPRRSVHLGRGDDGPS